MTHEEMLKAAGIEHDSPALKRLVWIAQQEWLIKFLNLNTQQVEVQIKKLEAMIGQPVKQEKA